MIALRISATATEILFPAAGLRFHHTLSSASIPFAATLSVSFYVADTDDKMRLYQFLIILSQYIYRVKRFEENLRRNFAECRMQRAECRTSPFRLRLCRSHFPLKGTAIKIQNAKNVCTVGDGVLDVPLKSLHPKVTAFRRPF